MRGLEELRAAAKGGGHDGSVILAKLEEWFMHDCVQDFIEVEFLRIYEKLVTNRHLLDTRTYKG